MPELNDLTISPDNPKRLHGCQSKNHSACNLEDGLWLCARCQRWMCLEEGMPDDGYYDHCDDCWAQETYDQARGEVVSPSGSVQARGGVSC